MNSSGRLNSALCPSNFNEFLAYSLTYLAELNRFTYFALCTATEFLESGQVTCKDGGGRLMG